MKKKYNILLALQSLGIGGAETHAVELCKGLVKEGFNITVVSKGGIYVKEIEDLGIKHYYAPLDSKNVVSLIKSFFTILTILSKESIDLIHAHARIAAVICNITSKIKRVPFITTSHGIRTKYIGTTWGERTIAVSEHIKEQLIKDFHVKEENIFVTVNAINMETFNENVDYSYLLTEFNIDKESKKLLHVSRFDKDREDIVLEILNAADEALATLTDAIVVLVGDGDIFHIVAEKAKEINKKYGRKAVILTGKRTDINAFMAMCDVFVGSERTALEAMAIGKTVLFSAKHGYMGIFTEEKLIPAAKTNFTLFGFPKVSKKEFADDIIKAFNLTEEEKQHIKAFQQQFIIENYSINKMVSDNINVYLDLLETTKILVSGYYGFNNSGDESILMAMYKSISNMDERVNITVLSNKPEETKIKYNVHAIYRFNLFDVIMGIKHTDILISGGGSLLQDRTSTRSLIYYTSIIGVGKLFNKKVMLYSNGIGPITKFFNRKVVKIIVNAANLVTLREQNSYDELLKMGVTNKNIFVTADPVFTMAGIRKEEQAYLLKQKGIDLSKKIIGVSVRNWPGIEGFVDEFAKLLDYASKKYDMTVVFIVMQVPHDIETSERVGAKMKCPYHILKDTYSPYEIMGMMGNMDMVISMRLHTLIFAARQKIPMIGIIYDPKIEYYLELLNMPSGGTVTSFTFESTYHIVDDMIENRDAYISKMDLIVEDLAEKAKFNEFYLKNLIHGQY